MAAWDHSSTIEKVWMKGGSPRAHLLMSLGQLLQVALQEADLLLVGGASLGILRVGVILYGTQLDFSPL